MTELACTTDSTCKWTQTKAAGCSGGATCTGANSGACTENNVVCSWNVDACQGGTGCTGSSSDECVAKTVECSWADAATGTCTDKTCADYTDETPCKNVATCDWVSGSCTTKSASETSCASYTTESTCKAVTTCEWSNNACSAKSTTTTPEGNGVFGLKSSILLFLISFLF